MAVATMGVMQGLLGLWGRWSWFRLELTEPPLVAWYGSSWLVFAVFVALLLWSLVVAVLAEMARDGDRHRWVWGWRGLALVALISLLASYVGSRNGVALHQDRIVWRQSVLAPLTTTTDADIASLNVSCEMIRRPSSVRRDDLIDRPFWTLSLTDGRSIRLGGIRGEALGNLDHPQWLIVMRRVDHLPRRFGTLDRRCVDLVVARFDPAQRPYVRSLFGPQLSFGSLSQVPDA